jgi:hypothetical protein
MLNKKFSIEKLVSSKKFRKRRKSIAKRYDSDNMKYIILVFGETTFLDENAEKNNKLYSWE